MDFWVVWSNVLIVIVSIVGMCLDHHTIRGLIDIINKLTPTRRKVAPTHVKHPHESNVERQSASRDIDPGKDAKRPSYGFGFRAIGRQRPTDIGNDAD